MIVTVPGNDHNKIKQNVLKCIKIINWYRDGNGYAFYNFFNREILMNFNGNEILFNFCFFLAHNGQRTVWKQSGNGEAKKNIF